MSLGIDYFLPRKKQKNEEQPDKPEKEKEKGQWVSYVDLSEQHFPKTKSEKRLEKRNYRQEFWEILNELTDSERQELAQKMGFPPDASIFRVARKLVDIFPSDDLQKILTAMQKNEEENLPALESKIYPNKLKEEEIARQLDKESKEPRNEEGLINYEPWVIDPPTLGQDSLIFEPDKQYWIRENDFNRKCLEDEVSIAWPPANIMPVISDDHICIDSNIDYNAIGFFLKPGEIHPLDRIDCPVPLVERFEGVFDDPNIKFPCRFYPEIWKKQGVVKTKANRKKIYAKVSTTPSPPSSSRPQINF